MKTSISHVIPLTVAVASNAGEFLSSRTLLRMSPIIYVQENSAWNSRVHSCSQVYYYAVICIIYILYVCVIYIYCIY